MHSGTIGEWTQNKSGVYYTNIKYDDSDAVADYRIPKDTKPPFAAGTRVSFEEVPPQNGAKKPSAKNVRLFNASAAGAQRRDADTRQGGTGAKTAYYLPKDTSDLLFGASGVPIDNTALKMQKYIRVFFEKEKKLKVLSGQAYTNAEKSLLTRLARSQLDVLSAYAYSHCVTGALGSRMIVGLGGGSVFETAITLHHTYGFPYIPGSAVKGCMRSFVIRDLFGGDEQAALADDDFVKAFGSQERRGGVIFLDALPTKCDNLELDIMNPHYAEYYQGKCEPTDDMNPTPIKFYAVPKDTQFTFRLASGTFDIKRAAIKDVPLAALLETTLSEIGVGAKTAVGYGWFRDIKEVIV